MPFKLGNKEYLKAKRSWKGRKHTIESRNLMAIKHRKIFLDHTKLKPKESK